MSSDTVVERFLKRAPRHGGPMREFLDALRAPRTYAPLRNSYALFGFLWGLPVPFFSIAIDLWASGQPFSLGVLWNHPIHLVFLLHPILFAVVFGAMGTVRHRKDRQITHLVADLEHHVLELDAANERLRELDRLKAEFVANVTHELKTPLVAIRGYNESILEGRFGSINDKQRDGLSVAVRNVERLQRLIEEILEFERMDSGKCELALADFDLVPLIEVTLKNFEPQIGAKRLAVELDLPTALHVRADRERISRVLLNLVSNAVKFSNEGGAIGIDAAERERQVHVTVWDRGQGIPAGAQKFLFTRFWQADGSSRRRHGGTGLGLAIVKAILDAHGSKIEVESAAGAGTRIRFTLPVAETGRKEGIRAEEEAARPGR